VRVNRVFVGLIIGAAVILIAALAVPLVTNRWIRPQTGKVGIPVHQATVGRSGGPVPCAHLQLNCVHARRLLNHRRGRIH
jgi:hypothetical protein